jgi:hypothetical protein
VGIYLLLNLIFLRLELLQLLRDPSPLDGPPKEKVTMLGAQCVCEFHALFRVA